MEKEKVNEKELQITVAFGEEKLDALNYFMKEKGTTLEEAMQDHMNEVYEKYVPSAVRRFMGKDDGPEKTQVSAAKTKQMEVGEKETNNLNRRAERRQAKEQNQSVDSPLPEAQEEAPAEENGMGMTMNM